MQEGPQVGPAAGVRGPDRRAVSGLAQSRSRPSVVIVGAGFAGLAAAEGLGRDTLDVTVIDRRNHHLFQPLLYQVATAALSPADIAAPIRSMLRGQRNTEVLLDEVVGIDTATRRVGTRDRRRAPLRLPGPGWVSRRSPTGGWRSSRTSRCPGCRRSSSSAMPPSRRAPTASPCPGSRRWRRSRGATSAG